MNDTLKMYGSIGSEIMNRYFVVAMCFKRQPRWRRLQTINCHTDIVNSEPLLTNQIFQVHPLKANTISIVRNPLLDGSAFYLYIACQLAMCFFETLKTITCYMTCLQAVIS